MRNLLVTAGAAIIMTTSFVGTISCGSTVDADIFIALDGADHSVHDNSFNQQAYEGAREVGTTAIVKPAGSDDAAFKAMYAKIPDNKIIVAPGFLHLAPLNSATTEIENKKVILIDGVSNKSNIASVIFEVQQAAYLAGYALVEFASTSSGFNALKGNDELVKISTFGGNNIESVTAFMNGFKVGFDDGKIEVLADSGTYPEANKVEFTNLSNWFSGGFAPGGAATVVNDIVSKDIDVVLPVAGPQTGDVLSATNFTGKVIGVDVAQEQAYSTYSDRFLFSILKNIKLATSNLIKKLQNSPVDDFYKGLGQTTIGNIENSLVGISDFNQAIKDIYDVLLEDASVRNDAGLVQKTGNWY